MAAGDRLRQFCEDGSVGYSHHRRRLEVPAANLVLPNAEGGRHPATRRNQIGQHKSVAGRVEGRVDSLRVPPSYRADQVAGIVDTHVCMFR